MLHINSPFMRPVSVKSSHPHPADERTTLARKLLEIENSILSRYIPLSALGRKVAEEEQKRKDYTERHHTLNNRIEEVSLTKQELSYSLRDKQKQLAEVERRLKEILSVDMCSKSTVLKTGVELDDVEYRTQMLEKENLQISYDNQILEDYRDRLLRAGPVNKQVLNQIEITQSHSKLTRLQNELTMCGQIIEKQTHLIRKLQNTKQQLEHENESVMREFRRLGSSGC